MAGACCCPRASETASLSTRTQSSGCTRSTQRTYCHSRSSPRRMCNPMPWTFAWQWQPLLRRRREGPGAAEPERRAVAIHPPSTARQWPASLVEKGPRRHLVADPLSEHSRHPCVHLTSPTSLGGRTTSLQLPMPNPAFCSMLVCWSCARTLVCIHTCFGILLRMGLSCFRASWRARVGTGAARSTATASFLCRRLVLHLGSA